MLRLTVSPEEYLMIGDNIKIVFLGGSKNHLQVMVDVPRDVDIMRSEVYERMHPEAAEQNNYYAEPDLPKKYRKPKQRNTRQYAG